MRYYGVQNEVKSYLNRLQSEAGLQVSVSTVKTLNDRVESLKKSGVWSQYGLGFNDADADRYFQRASVNNVLGRFEVCLFVRGMKTLGLWQNMVSWPLRSYQNAGTGSTAYSLGGLGVYDGSMINSPTWGVNGVEFSALTTRQYINVSGLLQSFNTNSSSVFAASLNSYTSTVPRLLGTAEYPASELTVTLNSNTVVCTVLETWSEGGYSAVSVNPNLNLLTMHTMGCSFDYNNSLARYLANNTVSSTTRATSNPGTRSFHIAAGQGLDNHWNGKIAYGLRFNTALTNSQLLQVKNILTQSLGSSLGLP